MNVADELDALEAEIEALSTELATNRTLGIAVGIVAERLKINDGDAEQALRALAARDGRRLADMADELARTKRLVR